MKLDKLNWEAGAGTEMGYVRKENQDRMSWANVPWGQLYIIADGMGSHDGGAQAAELTVHGLEWYLTTTSRDTRLEEAIRNAFDKTNKDVYEKAHSGEPETEGIGSTAVILVISGQLAKIAHVGNSRAYLYRDGKLRLLTKDHTQAQRFVDAGMMKPEKACSHPSARLLERAIGQRPAVSVDICSDLVLKEGDGILLCSDGLSWHTDDQEIEVAISSSLTSQETVTRLINLALKNGGEDNVTVQFVRYKKRPEVPYSAYNGKLKSIIFAILIASFATGGGFLTYRLIKNTAKENVTNLQKEKPQTDTELVEHHTKIKELVAKIKELNEQVLQLNDNLSARDLELANTKKAEQQAASQIKKLENQLSVEVREKKRLEKQLGSESRESKTLEKQLKTIAQEKNTTEKQNLASAQMVKKLKENESVLKRKIKTLETQLRRLQLLYLRSPVSDKESK
jgi:PPM family protein phosphatase